LTDPSRKVARVTAKQKIFWLRLVTLIGLCLPALELAWRWYNGDLEPRPVTVATHSTGDWAVIFLMLSLAMTPARTLLDWMPLVQIRRRIGVAAALYAGAHFLIYVLDQKWNLVVVATEIAKRFYLTIGFVTLLMLVALAITSTDGWQKRLRRNWKRLHWLIYPAAFIAIVHFFIQSKVKIGEPAFTAGLFAWLMLWRALPPRLQRGYLGLVLLGVSATLATVVFEATWYWLVNGRDPTVALLANLDPELVFRPAQKVLIASLLVIAAVGLRRLALATNKLWTKRYIQSTIPTP
jgi:sulfoxide reductase heme-binding subunit YedZ